MVWRAVDAPRMRQGFSVREVSSESTAAVSMARSVW